MTENQVYAAADGRPVTVKDGDRESASRNGKSINATDYVFDVAVNGARHEVRVAVSRDAVRAVTSWLAEPANFGSSESKYVDALLVDLSTAKILEAVDRGIDFEQDLEAYPDSFLKILAGDLEQFLQRGSYPRKKCGTTSAGDCRQRGKLEPIESIGLSCLTEKTPSTFGFRSLIWKR